MTNEETMTKEKVLKGLKICKDLKNGMLCRACPYFEIKNSRCLAELLNDAYNLLKTEVE